MERAREELHAEALRNKEAKEAKIRESCPNLPDMSAMAEGIVNIFINHDYCLHSQHLSLSTPSCHYTYILLGLRVTITYFYYNLLSCLCLNYYANMFIVHCVIHVYSFFSDTGSF